MKKAKGILMKRIGAIFLALVILAGVACVGFYSVQNINNSQYEERIQNLNILMEKICHHIKSAVNFNWQNSHYIAGQLENEKFTSMSQMLDYISVCEDSVKGEENTKILMISDAGLCYVTDGTTFRWMNPSSLNETVDVMYVSDHQFASKTGNQMHYLSRFSKPIEVDGLKFTHMSLVCDMKEMDSFFDVSDYGDDSITFIIHKDGSQVYRQQKETKLSGIYNLLSVLDEAEFGYGVSYEKMQKDFKNNVSDSVQLTLDGDGYYTSYYHLGIKDWVAVLMIPEEHTGIETQEFTHEIVWSVVLLIGSILVALFIVFGVSYYRMEQKRKNINEQLVRAAEAERSANEAKTTFLSSMSHDIRTPMNAIIGMVAIASKRIDDKDYIRECLKKIDLASSHLLTLINDILDISKVESGKMRLNPENFSISESFENLINIMQPQIREKNQEFYIRVHHVEHEYLNGDKLRLNQIFINLLSNAIKYTGENGKIWVDLYEESIPDVQDKVRIRYVVKDNGMGMSPEFQETMYSTFSRASDSRTSKIQGSGLGLAICKQMVELMNGTIACESELGVGTTFTVTVDLAVAAEKEEEMQLPSMRMLLIDDDEVFLETAKDTLESLGLTVDTAVNAEEGIMKLQSAEEAYPMIIVDKRLPDMDGVETVRKIRSLVPQNTPILMVSAYDASLLEDDAKAAGADSVITKPFFKKEVFTCIQGLISDATSEHIESENNFGDLSGMKLLIAEDNDLNWEIAYTLLEMYGVSADRAENGKKCVEMMHAANEGDYALVLMDVRMPVMDGREATRLLRRSDKEWLRNIPIIAMTADAFAEDIHECLEAGMNEHLSKPLDVERLLRVLQKYS